MYISSVLVWVYNISLLPYLTVQDVDFGQLS